jgi:uncharacterized membrane protein YphA (DoxX/SURF4 family)
LESAILVARLTLAAVFIVAALGKLADLDASRRAVEQFGVRARAAGTLGVVLPLVELGLAVALIPVATARWAAGAAVALLIAFCVVVARALVRGDEVECNCFGNIGSALVGPATLVRNVGLAVVAGFIALAPGAPGASVGAWLGQRSDAELVALWLGLALVGLASTSIWFGRELLRQHGRLMLRVEALEGAGRPGLPMGASAPSFAIQAWSGGELSLDRLLTAGSPVLLVFSDAHCGPCAAAVPLVANAQRDWAGRLTIAVISTGATPESEATWREQHLEHVGIASDFEVASSYGIPGSPAAVLVSAEGHIDSHTAQGLGQVTELLRAPAGHGVGADRDGDLGGTYELSLTFDEEGLDHVEAP